MTSLNTASLRSIDPAVAVPQYDRSAVTAGIVHFGVGAFHRAHQALYLDRLMNEGRGAGLGHLRGRRAAGRQSDARRPRGARLPLHVGGEEP